MKKSELRQIIREMVKEELSSTQLREDANEVAVQAALDELRAKFPGYTFSATRNDGESGQSKQFITDAVVADLQKQFPRYAIDVINKPYTNPKAFAHIAVAIKDNDSLAFGYWDKTGEDGGAWVDLGNYSKVLNAIRKNTEVVNAGVKVVGSLGDHTDEEYATTCFFDLLK